MNRFGAYLSSCRISLGLSLAKVAKRAEVSTVYVHDVEQARRPLALKRFRSWARIYSAELETMCRLAPCSRCKRPLTTDCLPPESA